MSKLLECRRNSRKSTDSKRNYHDSPTSKLCEFTNGNKVQVQDFSGKKGNGNNREIIITGTSS